MLPVAIASVLLFVSGVWWTASILSSLYWERHYETPGRRSERLREHKTGRDRLSSVVGAIMFGIPAVVTLGLSLDGLAGSGMIFYAPGWSWFLPGAAFQLLGAVFVFVGLPLFTWTVYLVERDVYSRVEPERVLIQRGPYAHIRHPMHLAAFLLGIGWVLLAQHFAALVLLFLLEGALVAKKEEADLVQTYGAAYRAYQSRTGFFLPRWGNVTKNEPDSLTPRP